MVDPDWPYSSARAADVRAVTVDTLLDMIAAVDAIDGAAPLDRELRDSVLGQLRKIMEGEK